MEPFFFSPAIKGMMWVTKTINEDETGHWFWRQLRRLGTAVPHAVGSSALGHPCSLPTSPTLCVPVF